MTKLYNEAFTMIELMVIFVISGILVGMAIPQFIKTIDRTRGRSVVDNLSIIHAANAQYRLYNNGTNLVAADINAINTALATHIIADGVSYSCGSGTCVGSIGSGLTVTVTLASPVVAGTNPSCAGANCP